MCVSQSQVEEGAFEGGHGNLVDDHLVLSRWECGHNLPGVRALRDHLTDLIRIRLALPDHCAPQLPATAASAWEKKMPREEDAHARDARRFQQSLAAGHDTLSIPDLRNDSDLHLIDDQREPVRREDVRAG